MSCHGLGLICQWEMNCLLVYWGREEAGKGRRGPSHVANKTCEALQAECCTGPESIHLLSLSALGG